MGGEGKPEIGTSAIAELDLVGLEASCGYPWVVDTFPVVEHGLSASCGVCLFWFGV